MIHFLRHTRQCHDDRNATPSSVSWYIFYDTFLTIEMRHHRQCRDIYFMTHFWRQEYDTIGSVVIYIFCVFYYNPNSITLLVCQFDTCDRFLSLGHRQKKVKVHLAIYTLLVATEFLTVGLRIDYKIKIRLRIVFFI